MVEEYMMNAHLDEETRHYMNGNARAAFARVMAEWPHMVRTGERQPLWNDLGRIAHFSGCDGVETLIWEIKAELWKNRTDSLEVKQALRDLQRIFDDVLNGSIPAR